ncbi:MAG: metalloregulator ArsR/SmtB family transcription factor [Acidocella sp.]|nr:metalloregulator ArsR/SmtB family transcription factor [Acidocella sp.]
MSEPHLTKEAAAAATEKLKVFVQPQRLMILSLLRLGERTVTEIETATGISQPALSQQLAALRRVEVVGTRRKGKQIFYRLAHEKIAACIRNINVLLCDTPSESQAATPPELSYARHSSPPLSHTGAAIFAKIL